MSRSQIVIVGAGISGLATAVHLQALLPEADITVLEASHRPGGTIWTERRDGFQVELGANGFLDNKPSTLTLCERLGLRDQLISANDVAKHRYLFWQGRLQALPESFWTFLRSPLLRWRSKAALLTERFHSVRRDGVEESVHDFVARRTTTEVAELFADASVTGIHAGDPKLLSMSAAFPRMVSWERQFGSVTAGMKHAARERRRQGQARGSRLLSFRDGLRVLIEALRDRLRKPPGFGVRVRSLSKSNDPSQGWVVRSDGCESWSADAVVLSCPAYQQAVIVGDLDPSLREQIAAIPYSPAVVVALGFRREDVPHDLNGFGYIAPQRTRQDILGAQWCSSIFPGRAPDGMVLLRAIAGGWHRRDVATWDDQKMVTWIRQQFQASMGIAAEPVFQHLTRWERAIPQYHLGHLERVARMEAIAAKHPGLFLTGNAYRGVAMNDCTEQAEGIAAKVAIYLHSTHRGVGG